MTTTTPDPKPEPQTDPEADPEADPKAGAPRARRGLLRAVVGVLALIAVATVLVLVLGDRGPSAGGDGTDEPLSKLVQTYDEAEREPIDDFTAELLDGDRLDTAQLRGEVTVFNVWGSWCGPCRTEAPDLARVASERAEEVSFYGINVRDNADAARAFERAFEVPYPSVRPEDSADAILAFRGALASAAVPSTVILDAEGRVAARVVGPVTYRTLDALLTEVVATSGSGARG